MSAGDETDNELQVMRQEAAAWVSLLASGKATAADAAALERWCRRSPRHAATYAEASRLWKEVGPAAHGLRQRGAISSGLPALPDRRRVVTRRMAIGGALAASAAAAASVSIATPPLGLWPSFRELTADHRTDKGEQREVALAGEISVHMNTQTSIAVRSSDPHAEQVELVSGEASFAMAPQSQGTLTVLAAQGRAVGSAARFDVRCTGATVSVTCARGNVRVEQGSQVASIGPGQRVQYGDGGVTGVETVDPELVMAWQQGVLIFRLTPLQDVVEEVNRYRPGRVILLNTELGRRLVSGRFRLDHIDDILLRLEQAFGAKTRAIPGGIVLLT